MQEKIYGPGGTKVRRTCSCLTDHSDDAHEHRCPVTSMASRVRRLHTESYCHRPHPYHGSIRVLATSMLPLRAAFIADKTPPTSLQDKTLKIRGNPRVYFDISV